MSDQQSAVFDTSVFERVIDAGTVEQRQCLAHQLSQFIADPETPAEERGAVLPSAMRLTVDPVLIVRRVLAAGLTPAKFLDGDLVFAIAADTDEVAVQFLTRTPALDNWHMLAILKVGEPAKQAAVASRGDLGQSAVDFIVEYCGGEAVASLLDNPCVVVTPDQCKMLYVRLTDEPEVVDRLLERSDLPLEIRLMHAKRTSKRVYHLVAQRGWMAANDAETFVAETEEETYIRILELASLDELDRLIPFMCEQQLLTPSIILRAACSGDLEMVERSLGYLASVPAKKVRGLASGRGLKTLLGKAGMPETSFMLMRAVFDVAADARLNGKELSVEQFGGMVIEFIMTRYDRMIAGDKSQLLDMMAKFGSERTRKIALRVKDDLRQAA